MNEKLVTQSAPEASARTATTAKAKVTRWTLIPQVIATLTPLFFQLMPGPTASMSRAVRTRMSRVSQLSLRLI